MLVLYFTSLLRNHSEKLIKHVTCSITSSSSPGHFLLTHLLLDLMKRSAPARIVTVSSMAHSWGSINLEDINSEKGYNKSNAYSQSKLANVLFTHTLAKKLEGECHALLSVDFHFILKAPSGSSFTFLFMFCSNFLQISKMFSLGTGVTTYSLHPGVVQTDLWRHLNGPMQLVMRMVSPFTKDSVQGAQTSIYCAVEPSLEKESGGYYRYFVLDCSQQSVRFL